MIGYHAHQRFALFFLLNTASSYLIVIFKDTFCFLVWGIIAKKTSQRFPLGCFSLPVSRVLSRFIIYLTEGEPSVVIDLPSATGRAALHPRRGSAVYLIFQSVRFTPSGSYHPEAQALTLRFHPYPSLLSGGLLSVALAVSRESPPCSPLFLTVRCPVLPGLSSSLIAQKSDEPVSHYKGMYIYSVRLNFLAIKSSRWQGYCLHLP